MAHAKGTLAPTGAKARALVLLAETPAGLTTRDIATKLELAEQRISNAMSDLQRAGVIVGMIEAEGQATARRRWCLPQHAETARASRRKVGTKASHWQKSGLGKTPYREQIAANLGSAKVTVCPGYVDERFKVDTLEQPFFSKMRPGRYLETGSAIERAYAARGK